MAVIERGQEPQNIKKRMDTLFAKLDGAYPERVIIGLQKDHKKWDETARDISKLLGYESKNDFLVAYGYTIKKAETGRPRTTNYNDVVGELMERYPEGAAFTRLGDLIDANADMRAKLKTMSNMSKELFGMTLKDYFVSLGLITKAAPATTGVHEKKEQREETKLVKMQEKYELELELWNQQCKEIGERKEKLISERIAEARREAELPFQRAFEAEIQGANKQKTENEKKKRDAEKQLAGLGVFDFIKKKNLKKEIDKATKEIADAENRIKAAKQKLKSSHSTVLQKLSQKEAEIRAEVENELPMLPMPEKPIDTQI